MLTHANVPLSLGKMVKALDSINKALKPVSEFADIFSGENDVTTSSLLPVLQLIKKEILAEADEDTALTKDLKAAVLMLMELKYDNDSIKELMSGARPRSLIRSIVGFIFPKQIWAECKVEEQVVSLARQMHHIREEQGRQEGDDGVHPPPPEPDTLGCPLSVRSAAPLIPKTTEENVAVGVVIYDRKRRLHGAQPLQSRRTNESRFLFLSNVARQY